MRKLFARFIPVAIGMLAAGCSTSDNDPSNYYYEEAPSYLKIAGEPAKQAEGDQFEDFSDNPFVKVSDEPTSTFSVDADGASYGVMRRYINDGYLVDTKSVRIEEFLNYFTFDYDSPKDDNAVAINAETGPCPWNPQHRLLRLGLKGKEIAPDKMPQANFVFLVDVSGSMDSKDRLYLLKSGLKELLYQLSPEDRISLITYSGNVKKLLESTPVREAAKIRNAIDRLRAEGTTAGGEALKMAYEEATVNYDPTRNNRIIMGTDGDFNVGVTNTSELVKMVEEYARKGIYLTCLGFGQGNLNDEMMEKISNSGNGTYHYIDCEDEIMKVFVHERERFVSVANDTKCQVTFDSTYVSSYRLIGYENRVMDNKDFEDDKKDAGEIGAGQTITALYELVPTEQWQASADASSGSQHILAQFDVRYKKALGMASIPLKSEVTTEDLYLPNGEMKPLTANLSLAAGIATYGMLLRNSPHKGDANYDMAIELVKNSLSFDPHGYRGKLVELMKKAKDSQQ